MGERTQKVALSQAQENAGMHQVKEEPVNEFVF